MQDVIKVFSTFPLLFILLVAVPFFGGMVGAYLGYDNLKDRIATNSYREHVQRALDQISIPVETIRRYETQLSVAQNNTNILRSIIRQYDQLRHAITVQSQFTGQESTRDRIASSDQIIENLRVLLGATQTVASPLGQALIINTAPNTFQVLFSVPMRIAPRLEFRNLPQGVSPQVIEKTNIGFTVVFMPQSIVINTFDFTADSEIQP